VVSAAKDSADMQQKPLLLQPTIHYIHSIHLSHDAQLETKIGGESQTTTPRTLLLFPKQLNALVVLLVPFSSSFLTRKVVLAFKDSSDMQQKPSDRPQTIHYLSISFPPFHSHTKSPSD